MATLTQEQIDQKLQQLKQLAEEVSALTQELAKAGAIEIPEEDLKKVAGGLSNGEEEIASLFPKFHHPIVKEPEEPKEIPCPDPLWQK